MTRASNLNRLALVAAALLLTACASDHPLKERGWLGGSGTVVTDQFGPLPRSAGYGGLLNAALPENVDQDAALLVSDPGDDTPLAAAGIERGDLVLTLDGTVIEGGPSFRAAAEALEPGSQATLEVWRDGEVRSVNALVGKESYRTENSLSIFLSFWPGGFDIWPFDNGIDLLSWVVIKDTDEHYDSGSVYSGYLRSAGADTAAQFRRQDQLVIRIMPLGVSFGERVESQER